MRELIHLILGFSDDDDEGTSVFAGNETGGASLHFFLSLPSLSSRFLPKCGEDDDKEARAEEIVVFARL